MAEVKRAHFWSRIHVTLCLALTLLLMNGCGESEQQAEQQEPRTTTEEVTKEVTREVTKVVNATEPDADAVEEATSSAQPEESLQIGDSADLQGVQVTMNEVYRTIGDEFDQGELQSGDVYIVIDTTLENEGDATVTADTLTWTLYNQEGRQLESAYVSALDDEPEYFGDLRPGRQFSGPIAYVAAESDTVIAEYVPFEADLGTSDYATWDIGSVSELPEGAAEGQSVEQTSANSDTQTASADQGSIEQFISDYYAAVSAEDWVTTYSYLDSATQSEFTSDEWFRVQEARETAQNLLPISSATVNAYSEESTSYTVNVTRNYEDGTSDTLDNILYLEDGELKRHLTEEELSILESF